MKIMTNDSLFTTAANTIKEYDMLTPGDTVLIGLSGGADSVFLTMLLLEMQKEYDLTLKCAHVEHGIRGKDSVADCEFCRQLCQKNGIEFLPLSIDAPKEAAREKLGIEEYSRRRRYEFFNSVECDKIATAHNLSDNVETIVFRLIRGSSLKGVCGIPPKRGKIIRPLIEIPGDEIRLFLSQNSVEYRIDETNFETNYSRNYIRHKILPLFSKLNSSYQSSFLHFAKAAAADSAYLDSLAENAYEKVVGPGGADIAFLKACDASVRTRVIAKFIENSGAKVNYCNVTNVARLLDKPSKFQLSDNLYAISAAGRLRIAHIDKTDAENEIVYKTQIIDCKEFLNKCELSIKHFDFYCDYDKIVGNISVRRRCAGDFISPAGRGCTKSLKKLFNEMHIPPEERLSHAVITDGAGVIGVAGICADERVAVSCKTKKVFILQLCTED
ncbi:MAG: tRNA lysidine(34) synthetase TilS [Clostridiales bacterium]|nr:tRNA lysidine(34) synthetase TilS [Clostridiales bacterium]